MLTYTASGKLYFSVTPSGDLTKNDFNWHWYDAEGRRVISQLASLNYLAPFPHPDSVSGYRTYYVYDGSDVAMELVRTGGTWRVDRRFLSGGLDRPIGGRLFTGTTYQNIVFATDRGGSVINALDSAGAGVTNPAYFPRNAFVDSEHRLNEGTRLKISSPIFDEIGIITPVLRVQTSSASNMAGSWHIRTSFQSLDERSVGKIRTYLQNGLTRKKFA